jgi:altronate dehydratase
MSNDLDLSAGGIIDGTEKIEEVGRQVFEHMVKVADGEILAKAEINKHREFQLLMWHAHLARDFTAGTAVPL